MCRSVRARPFRWAAAGAGAGALLLLPLVVTGPAAVAASPLSPSAGLSSPVQDPDPVKTRLVVTNFGAKAGDSNDDSAAFRKAIAKATAGTEIYVPNGKYVFKTGQVQLKKGVSITGQSTAGAVITATLSSSNDDSSIFEADPGVGNLTISDLTLTSSGSKRLNYGLYLGSGGTSGSTVSRISVTRLKVERFYKMAIAVRNGENMTISENTITNALATGGGGEGYGIMIGYKNSKNNVVSENTITKPMRHGILLQYYAHHNLVEHNTVSGTTQDAYDLHGEDEYSNEFRYNTATGCGEGGFGVGNTGATHANTGKDNWIHHNVVTGCRWGIHIYLKSDQQYVDNNRFEKNTSYGVYIHDGGARDVRLTDNKVLNNGATGVVLNQAPGVVMTGNTVNGNKGALTTDAATTGYTITDNDLRNNGSGTTVKLGSKNGTFENKDPKP